MPLNDYAHPALTADVLLFAWRDEDLWTLLIRRKHPPFAGEWAIPGGFVDVGEPPRRAAQRELEEETGLRELALEQLHVFGEPGRDPRGHVVTVTYVGWVPPEQVARARAGDDAAEARWWSIRELPPLAFDHAQVLSYALQWLRARLTRTEGLWRLLPDAITVGELRAIARSLSHLEIDDCIL